MKSRYTACIIVARNIGDAIIQSIYIEKIISSKTYNNVIIWCRPSVAYLFTNIAGCKVVTSDFPIGKRPFTILKLFHFIAALLKIIKISPDISIDFIGDFRERIIGKIIAKRHYHIGWSRNHNYSKIIRNPFGTGNPQCVIPSSIGNVYNAYNQYLKYLIGTEITVLQAKSGPIKKIGIHPFASDRCRSWPLKYWELLIQKLVASAYEVTVFGADSERKIIENSFSNLAPKIIIKTGSLEDFEKNISEVDLLIGLDSCSVHMAYKKSVKTILIAGASDPALWSPPNALIASNSGNCHAYPCMNKPICKGTANEYKCIKSIEIQDVLNLLAKFILNGY